MSTKRELQIFCENIKYLRSANNLSKTTMTKKLGVCKKTLESLEKGVVPKRMSYKVLQNIYSNFGIKPDDILSNILENNK